MNIAQDTVVTLAYSVSEAGGKLLSKPKAPMAYLHGGYENTLPHIEAALDGQAPGFKTVLTLQPQDAFGLQDNHLVQTMPKRDFPPGVKVGGQIEGYDDKGGEHVFNVVKIKGDTVHLDGNHPWAGKVLVFSLHVTHVRAAIPEEIAHKHVHGEHGHQH